MKGAGRIDVAAPEHKANPFPLYSRLRVGEPVCRSTLPDRQMAWLITRYDDVAAVLRDRRFVKDRLNAVPQGHAATQPWMPRFAKPLTRNMLDVDEPDHIRLRALVNKAFTPHRVNQMREEVQSITDSLLVGLSSATGWT